MRENWVTAQYETHVVPGSVIVTEAPTHPKGDGFILNFYSDIFGEMRFLNINDPYGDFRNILQNNPKGILEIDSWSPTNDMPLSSIWGF